MTDDTALTPAELLEVAALIVAEKRRISDELEAARREWYAHEVVSGRLPVLGADGIPVDVRSITLDNNGRVIAWEVGE